jgi:phage terminase small subunit
MPNELKPVDTPNGAMTTKQDLFVDAYVANGGRIEAAAIDAGYSPASARTIGSRLVKDTKVLQEIYRRTVEQVALAAPKALATVERLAVSARSEKVQLEAAADLLNRAGVRAPERIDHRIGGEISVVIDLGS